MNKLRIANCELRIAERRNSISAWGAAWAGLIGSPLRVGEGPEVRSLRGGKGLGKGLSPLFLIPFLAIALCGCKPKQVAPKPPIVLIVIDTLRADHVGAYGCPRPTTPNIDAFAATAIRFDRAFAASSWTVPSMASLFTGVYPARHGIEHAATDGIAITDQQVLNPQFTTLAAALKEAGYATFGYSGNYHMNPRFGMALGFDYYKADGFANRDVVDGWLAERLPLLATTAKRGTPYFLYVHYFDPHHPYAPIKPFIDRFRPAGAPTDEIEAVNAHFNDLLDQGWFALHPEKVPPFIDCYDAEIAAVDVSIGALLKKLPNLEQAVVVITADHGEEFLDHGSMAHSKNLYSETLRVPLFVRLPHRERAGQVDDFLTSLVDLYPTLATLAHAAKPRDLAGVDLFDRWSRWRSRNRFIFAATRRVAGFDWNAALSRNYKLLYWADRGSWELYDLADDPREKRNVDVDVSARLLRRYQRELLAGRRERPLHPPGEFTGPRDEKADKSLKELGYL